MVWGQILNDTLDFEILPSYLTKEVFCIKTAR